MVNFTLKYDRDVVDALANDVRGSAKAVQLYAQKVVPSLIRRTLSPLTTEPRAPSLPFVWSYDPAANARARRWYFANKVKGRTGGRYARTHALVNNWRVIGAQSQNGAILTISNDTPGLDYVQGPRQVPSHQASGWAQYDDILLKAEEKANDLVIDFWLSTFSRGSTSGSAT